MISAKNVDTTNVTDEQIGACHKVFEGSTPVYMVESESDSLVEYKVRWSREHGFTCTCKSGQHGFAQCKDGICKHVKWAVAASREEKQALAELQAAITAQAAKPVAPTYTTVDLETRARVAAASERAAQRPASKAKAPTYKPFSLLR